MLGFVSFRWISFDICPHNRLIRNATMEYFLSFPARFRNNESWIGKEEFGMKIYMRTWQISYMLMIKRDLICHMTSSKCPVLDWSCTQVNRISWTESVFNFLHVQLCASNYNDKVLDATKGPNQDFFSHKQQYFSSISVFQFLCWWTRK